MAKILLVYGTAYGQTERIARRIGDQLTARGHGVCMYRGDSLPANLPLEKYDGFVVAASVIRGRHQGYISDFVRRQAGRLGAVPSAFVSVSGSAKDSPQQARECAESFLRRSGWHPTFIQTFAGAVAYTQYGLFLRWIMKRISQRRGGPTDTTRDYDFTDWAAVDRFAERLAEAVPPARETERAERLLLQSGHPTV
jgi:menaquinone-dependent protoporphyrinogen oxidase